MGLVDEEFLLQSRGGRFSTATRLRTREGLEVSPELVRALSERRTSGRRQRQVLPSIPARAAAKAAARVSAYGGER
jgi:hypothetical protein